MSTSVQLKKANFLDVITDEPQTRGQIVDALAEFDFIDSWLTYLMDHFVNQGKVVAETGDEGVTMYKRKGKKSSTSGPRIVFLVEDLEYEDGSMGFTLTERELDDGQLMDKDAGEAATAKRAVKNATSKIFASYKADCETVKGLLGEADTEGTPEASEAA